jgi:hypothetical protein
VPRNGLGGDAFGIDSNNFYISTLKAEGIALVLSRLTTHYSIVDVVL